MKQMIEPGTLGRSVAVRGGAAARSIFPVRGARAAWLTSVAVVMAARGAAGVRPDREGLPASARCASRLTANGPKK